MKRTLFASAAVVVLLAVAAMIFNPIMFRHFAVLITFGKIPGLKPLPHTCPMKTIHERSRKYDHCFSSEGKIFEHNANHNETQMRDILKKALKEKCAVLISKPFKDAKCYERLKEAAQDESVKIRAKVNSPEIMKNKDRWFGSGQTEMHILAKNRPATEMGLGAILNEYEEGHSMKFTAFDNSLDEKVYAKVWDFDLSWINGMLGSTFLSNYNTTFVTTPFHSAFWDSLAYQCVGTKTWKMLTPDDALPTVRFFGAGFTYMAQCDDFPGLSELTFDVVSGPDTMYYFPPYWAHAVQTQAGQSVLLNFRAIDVAGIIKNDFLVGLHTLVGVNIYRMLFPGYDPDEVTYYYLTGEVPALQAANAQT